MEAAAVEMAWILSLQRGRCLSHHHRMLKTANVLHYPTSDEISLDKIYHYAAFVVAWLVANRRHHLDGRWQPRIWTGPGGEQKLGTSEGGGPSTKPVARRSEHSVERPGAACRPS